MTFIPKSTFNVLYIKDVNTTHDFYKSIDAEIIKKEDDKVVVHLGEFSLHFILQTTEPFEEYQFATSENNRGMGNLFYIEVDNLEEAYELAKNSTGKVKSEIKDNLWGGKEFLVEDPDGYKVVFYKMK